MNTPTRRHSLLLLAAFLLGSTGCDRWKAHDDDDVVETFTVCAGTQTKPEFLAWLNHSWVIAARYSEEAYGTSDLLNGLVFNMLINGIDFTALKSYKIAFADGRYSVTKDGRGLAFTLSFSGNFETWRQGDLIPYNVFALDSYEKDLTVSPLPPFNYHFEKGPLYGLLSGAPDAEGSGKEILTTALKLRKDLVSFKVDSTNTYTNSLPDTDGRMKIVMTTTEATLTEVESQINGGGFGFSYDNTEYTSAAVPIKQGFHDSTFLIKTDDKGAFWDGPYQSTLEKAGVTRYLKGQASNRQPNTVDYFCDSELATKIGTLQYAVGSKGKSSSWTFVFADGKTLASPN